MSYGRKCFRRCPITRNIRILCILLVLLAMAIPVYAAPVTGAVTKIGNNNATFNAAGASGLTWFEWGLYTGKLYLHTKNVTAPGGGAVSITVKDYPFYGSTKYYVRACDTSGCGAEVDFTILAVTPLPTTTYGATFTNMTESDFDIAFIPGNAITPYTWPLPTEPEGAGTGILTGLALFGLFAGLWIRGKNAAISATVGAILTALFAYSDSGLKLGVPPEFLAVGQGVFCLAMAGILLWMFKKG